jgi:DNA repair exonuclease SbcCD ATPase subunit/predicted MPP superfamily phosphohydrolase
MKIKTKFKTLKKIYHISDIQIRNLQRHKEFEKVFENLYEFIKKDTENAIVYIGGDIAHSKTDMSPELVDQLSRLFKRLSELCPTLLIAGNHDCNLNNPSRLDVLQPIVENIKNENLHYLNESGVYYIGDVGFAVLEVRDDESNLPDPATINANTKILLYHGTVDKSQTDLGFYLPSAVKLKDFNGYDMVMLGDIHKMQTMQEYKQGKIKKPAVRYCGSLVQQNHGETLKGHGVSVWDVKNRKFTHKEIENEYGYYTLYIEDGLVPKVDDLPSKARLRIKVKNTSSSDLKKALTIIKHRHNIKEVSIVREDEYRVDTGNSSIVDFGDVFDPDVQNGLIEQYLINNTTASEEIIEKVKKINKELSSSIVGEEISRNISWKPKKFTFSNMFSYGENNVINFERCNGIAGLFSPNASGKSSVLDSLTYCLFDKSTRAYKAENVMNHSKSNFSCELEFDVGNDSYVIKRVGKILRHGSTRVDVDFYRLEDGKKVSLNGDQRNSTNKNIRKLIGTYDDFIMTSFSAQGNSSIFLEQNQTEKKEILGKFLGLSIFDQLYKLAREESSGLQSMLKNFLDIDYDQQISDIETELDLVKEVITKLEDSQSKKEIDRDKYKNKTLDLMGTMKPIDATIKDLKELEDNQQLEEGKKVELLKRLNNTKDELSETRRNDEILANRIKSEKYKDIENRTVEYELIVSQRDEAKRAIDNLKIEVRNKLDKIDKLGNLDYDPGCSYCMNNVFVKDAIKTKADLEQDKTRATSTVAKLKTLENKIQINEDVPKSYSEFLDLTKELENNKKYFEQYEIRTKDINDAIKSTESYIASIKNEIKRSKGYQKDIKHNDRVQLKINDQKSSESIVETELKAVVNDIHQYVGKKSALETKKQEIVQVINRVKDLEEKYEAYKYYLMAVDKNGVSYDLISKVLTKVESEVNNILSQIVDFQIIFDMDGKNINNYIAYDNDKSWALEMASGMEKFISGLAIRIALTNISNLPRPNFIAIDEGWGTMDSDNLNSLYQLFQYLKNIYQFSLIISHIDTMRDFTDILLEIKQENNHSKIIF